MPNTIQVTGDDDPFITQQNEVAEALEDVQKALQPNDVMVCVECDGPIEPERKEALPSAVTCIECAAFLAEGEARKDKLHAKMNGRPTPGSYWGQA